MLVHGRCHCGNIAYEAEVDPARVALCHCTDCQMLTGSAYRVSLPVPAADFHLLRGTPRAYTKTGTSGARRVHAFCPDCGTPVYSCAEGASPPAYSLRIGCLDERAALPPRRQIWCGSAMPWSRDVTAVPGQEGQ
ncbi:MAG: GFA family protein [Pseudomonadota bacterium]